MKHLSITFFVTSLSCNIYAMQEKENQLVAQVCNTKYEKESTEYTPSYFSLTSYTENALSAICKNNKSVEHLDATNKVNRALDQEIFYIQKTRDKLEKVGNHPNDTVDTLLQIARENRRHIHNCKKLIDGAEDHNLGVNPEMLKKFFRTLNRENKVYWDLSIFMFNELYSYYKENETLLEKTHDICSDHPGSCVVYPYDKIELILYESRMKSDAKESLGNVTNDMNNTNLEKQ